MRLIREECALRDNAAKLPEKKARIKPLSERKVPGSSSSCRRPRQRRKRRCRRTYKAKDALATLQQEVAADKQKLQKIADVRTRVASFKMQMARFYADIQPILREVGVPDDDRAVFHPAFPGDTESALARRESAIRRAIAQREGATENRQHSFLSHLADRRRVARSTAPGTAMPRPSKRRHAVPRPSRRNLWRSVRRGCLHSRSS